MLRITKRNKKRTNRRTEILDIKRDIRTCNGTSRMGIAHLCGTEKDGSWRVCGDFRHLNSETRTDRFPLPNITRINESLHGKRIFSKIDIARAYLQIDVAEAHRPKTAINTTIGVYQFRKMPYGLRNSGQCFQRNIQLLLLDMPNVFVYIDDIIISSPNHSQHRIECFVLELSY